VIDVVEDPQLVLGVVVTVQPTGYWVMVPVQAIGIARTSESSRGSSKPSPMCRPVATAIRGPSRASSSSVRADDERHVRQVRRAEW